MRPRGAQGDTTPRDRASAGQAVQFGHVVRGQGQGRAGHVVVQVRDGRSPGDEQDVWPHATARLVAGFRESVGTDTDDPRFVQLLVIYHAQPGTGSAEKLALLGSLASPAAPATGATAPARPGR
jgi:hypothetical protein